MIRPSALPQSEKCGLSAALALNDPRGPGTRGRIGTGYHALAAGASRAEVYDTLTKEEMADMDELVVPPPGTIPANATRERTLGLSPTGRYAEPGTPGNLTEGTPDVFWAKEANTILVDSPMVAVVADYKTGQLPVEDGPLSLQLVAYGFAVADLLGADSMCLGIWYARGEGCWDWSNEIPLDSEQAGDLWKRVTAAATAPPEARPGPHCESCWQRAICPARLLPAVDGSALGELEPFMEGSGTELTGPRAEVGLRLISAMREVADRAEEHIRAEVVAGRLTLERDGKIYGPSEVAGRRSASVEDLTKAGLLQYVKQGKPYLRWAWRERLKMAWTSENDTDKHAATDFVVTASPAGPISISRSARRAISIRNGG